MADGGGGVAKKRRVKKRAKAAAAAANGDVADDGGGADAHMLHATKAKNGSAAGKSVRFFGERSARSNGAGGAHHDDAYAVTHIELDEEEGVETTRQRVARMRGPEQPVVLQFNNITYDVPVPQRGPGTDASLGARVRDRAVRGALCMAPRTEKKRVLHGVSGKVGPGEFLVIMGPTGSGKSSLLNCISKRSQLGVSGDVLINGQPTDRNYKRNVAYVLQSEVLFENLTVQQTLDFTASLRLPKSFTAAEKRERVSSIIDTLNLAKARHTIIGGPLKRGVSGGERKRASIANELLTMPSLFLGDECTSGLDTSSAINLVHVLKGLSDAGLAVIAALHQPSSQMFKEFNTLMLLVDGRTCYYGPADEAVHYFASLGLRCSRFMNPADFLLSLILKEELRKDDKMKKQLVAAFDERAAAHPPWALAADADSGDQRALAAYRARSQRMTAAELRRGPRRYEYSAPYQFAALWRRAFHQAKGVYFNRMSYIQIVFVAVIVGILWFQTPRTEANLQDLLGALFFVGVFSAGFFAAFTALMAFPAERAVIKRERASGSYRLSSYFMAKVLTDPIFDINYTIIFAVITYWLVGFRVEFVPFLESLVTLCLTTITSAGMGLMLSAQFHNLREGLTALTVMMLTFMLLGGFYIRRDLLPVWLSWIQYISPLYLMYAGLQIGELEGSYYLASENMTSVLDVYAEPATNDTLAAVGPAGRAYAERMRAVTGTLPDVIPGSRILDHRDILFRPVWANWLMLVGISIVFRVIAFVLLRRSYKKKN